LALRTAAEGRLCLPFSRGGGASGPRVAPEPRAKCDGPAAGGRERAEVAAFPSRYSAQSSARSGGWATPRVAEPSPPHAVRARRAHDPWHGSTRAHGAPEAQRVLTVP